MQNCYVYVNKYMCNKKDKVPSATQSYDIDGSKIRRKGGGGVSFFLGGGGAVYTYTR